MREADVEKYLVKVVESMGGECRKVKWIGRRGAPDRVVFFGSDYLVLPRTIWVELKAPNRGCSALQLREHTCMRRLGQEVFVLDSIGAIDKWAASL